MSDDKDDEAQWRGDLLWAIEEPDPDRVATLAAGHDVNFLSPSSFTPLMTAVDTSAQGAIQNGLPWDLSVIEVLLSHGASPTMKGSRGEDATDIARDYHWHEALDAMRAADPEGVPRLFWPLGYVDRDPLPVAVPPVEDTPWRAELMDAIKRTDADRVRRLLADPQGTLDFIHPGSRLSPLQLAIVEQNNRDHPRTRDATIVRLLLDAGAATDFPPGSRPPLERAEGWSEVLSLLEARSDG